MKNFLVNVASIMCGVLFACILYGNAENIIDYVKRFDIFAGVRRRKEKSVKMDLNECDGKCEECVREACADPYA